MNHTILAQSADLLKVGPVELVTGVGSGRGPDAGSTAWSLWAWGAVLIVGVVLLAGSMVVRWWFAKSAEERAMWWLSRRAGLSRRDRLLIHTLAKAGGENPPVALLLSPRAFAGAVQAARGTLDVGAIERMRARIFEH